MLCRRQVVYIKLYFNLERGGADQQMIDSVCFFFVLQKRQEEGRIILYVTSFRGVRSTFEECRYVETILHNLRMKAEIRDIYVNKQFYRELEDRLEMYDEGKLPVPQLFISGQHIGVCYRIQCLL